MVCFYVAIKGDSDCGLNCHGITIHSSQLLLILDQVIPETDANIAHGLPGHVEAVQGEHVRADVLP